MADEQQLADRKSPVLVSDSNPNPDDVRPVTISGKAYLSITALIFSSVSACSFLAIIFSFLSSGSLIGQIVGQSLFDNNRPQSITVFERLVEVVAAYVPLLLFVFVGLVSSFIALRLFKASGASYTDIIPQKDYDLIAPLVKEAKSESINEYIRLSSLTGSVGLFTKLGLNGLPLATITLTLIFSAMALFDPATFLDMAKLTLGAFIGSYVQRNVEIRRADVALSPSSTAQARGAQPAREG